MDIRNCGFCQQCAVGNYDKCETHTEEMADIIRIAQLEQQLTEAKAEIERLAAINSIDNELSMQAIKVSVASNVALTDRIERLQAHNAMLVEAFMGYMSDETAESKYYQDVFSATSESIQQWLGTRDAEMLRKFVRYVDATPSLRLSERQRAELHRMANEVKS